LESPQLTGSQTNASKLTKRYSSRRVVQWGKPVLHWGDKGIETKE
jgi:hypothetical protein